MWPNVQARQCTFLPVRVQTSRRHRRWHHCNCTHPPPPIFFLPSFLLVFFFSFSSFLTSTHLRVAWTIHMTFGSGRENYFVKSGGVERGERKKGGRWCSHMTHVICSSSSTLWSVSFTFSIFLVFFLSLFSLNSFPFSCFSPFFSLFLEKLSGSYKQKREYNHRHSWRRPVSGWNAE